MAGMFPLSVKISQRAPVCILDARLALAPGGLLLALKLARATELWLTREFWSLIDSVFVFARAANGSRMPLAVQRAQVKDLPLAFKLDDSMAMAPGMTLSSAPQLTVGARISKSGTAIAQPGDLSGEITGVAPGANNVAIRIGTVVAKP